MKKRNKSCLVFVLAMILMAASGITAYAAEDQVVTTFEQFKTAVETGNPVQLGGNITADKNVGSTSKYIDADITIKGNGYTLDMGKYQFMLKGSHKIDVSDLTIKTANTNNEHRYGLFVLRAGSPTTDRFVWESKFHNLSFYGSALLGTYNTDDYPSTTRKFNSAEFTGNTYIAVTSPFKGHNGVIYANNIRIDDTFVMEDKIEGKNTGATNPTYQHYFKSPGTGGVDVEPDNNIAYGSFIIGDGANVTITRSPGQGGDDKNSAYYRSLIFGYADHSFGEGSNFYAKAGTNLTSSSDLLYRSAVIRSNNASSFIVNKDAAVKLETDLFNTTAAASKNGSYGYTALSLKKANALNIQVAEKAVLDIYADGRDVSPNYGTRAQAPVVIWGSGSSKTTVSGELKVRSENANGWYYAYETSKAGKAEFNVESTGNVEIIGNNLGVRGASEYAAFEAYGKYDVDINVRGGGKMTVFSNGYRGMSLAGAGGYNKKNINVSGDGSELLISGVHWAIAAETQPILNIAAEDGGKINLISTGDVKDGYNVAGSAPSTVYSVGPTTYKADGENSQINVHHTGGTYSAIFHDGYGPLKINVANGGVMDVYNNNTGKDTSARRAAITAQSTYQGSYKSYDNEIVVEGEGSLLNVVNKNQNTHGGGDTGLYPTGAVSFNCSAKGNIRIANGGSFKAVSESLAPTIHLYQGTITLDNPGDYDIRNNSVKSTSGNNNKFATLGQAVYNEQERGKGSFNTAIEFKNADVTVWSLLENEVNFADEYIDNRWEDVSFSANNKSIAAVGKDGLGGDTKLKLDQFELSSYGRISGKGDGGTVNPQPDPSEEPTIEPIIVGTNWAEGEGIPGSEITVIFPGDVEVQAFVTPSGFWAVPIPVTLEAGDTVYAYQTESGKLPSGRVSTVVRPRS